MTVDPDRSCPSPVVDRDPERTSRLVVFATTRDQGRKLADFDGGGVDFRPVKQR